METVFSHIVQKRFSRSMEDIATDVLAYILDSSEDARSGFMKLLRSIEADLPALRFKTQQSEDNSRPDMWGLDGSTARVLVENKFWAGLTENQPVSYLKLLAKVSEPTVLLLVVPAAREQTIWRELCARMSAADIALTPRAEPAGVVFSATTELGPVLALTSWLRLLAAMELESAQDQNATADLSQLRALCEAADRDAFVPVAPEELTDQRLPAFVLQMNTVVQESVDVAVTRCVLDIAGLRPQASWDRVGRYIKFASGGDCGAWIGIHFDLWKQHGHTPLWLIFTQDEFSRGVEAQRVLEPWASNEGIVSVSLDSSFCLGLDIPSQQEKDTVVRSIVQTLEGIGETLSSIPPKDSLAGPRVR
jgi:hypothetical protein